MKPNLFSDILCLAFIKKKVSDNIFYLFKGIIFAPFLMNEKRWKKEKNRDASNAEVAGDDVYPLF